ncbi:hypothetical protein [Kineococcus rubinsiae]|uniref:hypothetical protein n=1 Tax=Kineococcus rubinsiae TaxID=2609562 RepID=UPI00142F6434|nr:hypothetical protein [Kineococcus rubinsiae]NIZ90301.1 hypothetical protein [Kineococcus rubinsiae]
MSSLVQGDATAGAEEDAHRAARWAMAAQLLRRVTVALLMVVPMAMYAAALAESSRAVGWGLLVVVALAVWFAADAVQVRAGWHVLPDQHLPRRRDVALLAGVDVVGAVLLIAGFGAVSEAVGQVPALSAVPGAFLLYELAWFCSAAAIGAVVKVLPTRREAARAGRGGRQQGLVRRTRVGVWVLAPVHLAFAVATLLVAQARALPEVRADDLVFSALAAAALLAAPPLLRQGLSALRR